MNRWKNMEKYDLLFGVCFSVCMILFLWRCFYSVNYFDEPYGIAVTWRFFKGGALLAEEWHPSQQLTSWILYPLYLLWYTILGGNEGIMLAFRISYVVLQGILTVYCYQRLRKYRYFAVAAVLLFMLSTHNNMTTVNYNTIGIGCLFLLLTILFTEEIYQRKTLVLCGVLTAIVVLAQPYTLLLFILWGIAVGLTWLFFRKRQIPQLLRFRTYFYVGIGAAIVLSVFLVVVFSRAGLADVLNGIYYNVSDPEHAMDLHYKISKYFERFYRYYKYQILMIFASMIVGWLKDGKIKKYLRYDCMFFSTAAFVWTLIYQGWMSDYVPIDFISAPMAFYGAALYMIDRRKNRKLFWGWIIPAFLYTFCVQLATDTGILAVSAATIIASAGGMIVLAETYQAEREILSPNVIPLLTASVIALNLLQSSLFLYQRLHFTWWSSPVSECTEMIRKGPAKGIHTSREDIEWYENALEEIDSLKLKETDQFLIMEHASWLYLYADVPAATYSFWAVGEKNFLDAYYDQYPEKEPTVVYVFDVEDALQKGYVQQLLDNGYRLTEYESGNLSFRK